MKYLDIAIANECINTIDIKGREYSEVNQRIKAYRMVYPRGSIITDIVSIENGVVIMRASITDDDNNIIATGTAYEKEDSSFINKTSYIENCETSAIGRALGIAGFGIDVSVASAEEVQNAIQNQEVTQEEADDYILTFGRHKGKNLKDVPTEYIEWLLGNSTDERLHKIIELSTGITIPDEEETQERLQLQNKIQDLTIEKDIDLEEVKEKFKVSDLTEMTTEQMKKCIKAMEKKEM